MTSGYNSSRPIDRLKMALDVLALIRRDRVEGLPDSPITKKVAKRQFKKARREILKRYDTLRENPRQRRVLT